MINVPNHIWSAHLDVTIFTTSGQPAIWLTQSAEQLLSLPDGADAPVCIVESVCLSTERGSDAALLTA